MRSKLGWLYKKFNLLSLDVVIGSMLVSLAFWKLPTGNGQVNLPSILILGVVTWLIYILDRILDTHINSNLTTERHLFHQKNFFNLTILSFALIALAVTLCFLIPSKVFFFGLYLAAVLVVYFFFLMRFLKDKKAQWIKEPMTAIGYTFGVVGPSFINHSSINLSAWFLAFALFLIASQNLLIFSYFETLSNSDSENSVKFFGQKSSLRLIRSITIVLIILIILLFTTEFTYEALVAGTLLLMSLLISFMTAMPAFFLINDRYRWLGDGVFLLLFWVLLW